MSLIKMIIYNVFFNIVAVFSVKTMCSHNYIPVEFYFKWESINPGDTNIAMQKTFNDNERCDKQRR